mmetsp:Transcript_22101/g.50549  ORF Transcript_22101/g.50549 Transcript_22101/m.50549 type:complete len:277 (-) Transcript_22101:12-842(-)
MYRTGPSSSRLQLQDGGTGLRCRQIANQPNSGYCSMVDVAPSSVTSLPCSSWKSFIAIICTSSISRVLLDRPRLGVAGVEPEPGRSMGAAGAERVTMLDEGCGGGRLLGCGDSDGLPADLFHIEERCPRGAMGGLALFMGGVGGAGEGPPSSWPGAAGLERCLLIPSGLLNGPLTLFAFGSAGGIGTICGNLETEVDRPKLLLLPPSAASGRGGTGTIPRRTRWTIGFMAFHGLKPPTLVGRASEPPGKEGPCGVCSAGCILTRSLTGKPPSTSSL